MQAQNNWRIKCNILHHMWKHCVSSWCQDGNTRSRMITEVKQFELNQFSDGQNFLGSGECSAVEQSKCKSNIVAKGDGKFGPWGLDKILDLWLFNLDTIIHRRNRLKRILPGETKKRQYSFSIPSWRHFFNILETSCGDKVAWQLIYWVRFYGYFCSFFLRVFFWTATLPGIIHFDP